MVCSASFTNVALYIELYPDTARNWAVAEALRRHYEAHLHAYGLRVDDWHGSGATVRRDRVMTRLPTGYADGVLAAVAEEAGALIAGRSRTMTEHPLPGLDPAVDELAPQAAAYAWSTNDGENDL